MSRNHRATGKDGHERLRKQLDQLKRRLSQTKEEDERRHITREIDRIKSNLEDEEYD